MISDIELVFKNCIKYNEESSPTFSEIARQLARDFIRQLKQAGLNEHDNKPVLDKNKLEFSKGLYNISTVDLGAFPIHRTRPYTALFVALAVFGSAPLMCGRVC